MRISACTITRNEESYIEGSVKSYWDIADEIIIVDSGSTDQTVKIAEGLGARIYVRPWTDDFSQAKNFAIEKATGDWILFLDADEAFDSGGAKRARELMALADQDEQIDALSVHMKHFADKQGGVLMVHPIVRMFKNKRGISYHSRVHEYLAKNKAQLKVMSADETLLLHWGYIQSGMQGKLRRNLLLLEEIHVPPEIKCGLTLAKAECYNGLQQHQEVLSCIEEILQDRYADTFLRQSEKAPDVYRFQAEAMLALAECYTDEVIEACIAEGMARFPTHPEIALLRARFLFERNRRAEVIEPMEKALALDQAYKDRYVNTFSAVRGKSCTMLGDLYTFYRNDRYRARHHYEEALKLSKHDTQALRGLLWSLKGSDIHEIVRQLGRFYEGNHSEDTRMIMEAGLFCGMREVFTTYFLYFAKTWPDKLDTSQRLLYKVSLMKGDYQSLLDAQDPFWLIGALGCEGITLAAETAGEAPLTPSRLLWLEKWKNMDNNTRRLLLLDAVAEVIQAEDKNLLERILHTPMLFDQLEIKEDLARLFELMRDYKHAQLYYEQIGMQEEADRMIFLQR